MVNVAMVYGTKTYKRPAALLIAQTRRGLTLGRQLVTRNIAISSSGVASGIKGGAFIALASSLMVGQSRAATGTGNRFSEWINL
ncbi:hypothetical protein [Bradyrhizobium brasilense]|uniref:hypothetical protein n=1 Tax=Bradyrhizobium brasilense TaxID=1419277 RepID=UPI001E587E10|nr:hypothetical protein [Bradyrhizobium brasilense]MCC8968992.1 hypothetical protein [Bradyrhizobium brasilense]